MATKFSVGDTAIYKDERTIILSVISEEDDEYESLYEIRDSDGSVTQADDSDLGVDDPSSVAG